MLQVLSHSLPSCVSLARWRVPFARLVLGVVLGLGGSSLPSRQSWSVTLSCLTICGRRLSPPNCFGCRSRKWGQDAGKERFTGRGPTPQCTPVRWRAAYGLACSAGLKSHHTIQGGSDLTRQQSSSMMYLLVSQARLCFMRTLDSQPLRQNASNASVR